MRRIITRYSQTRLQHPNPPPGSPAGAQICTLLYRFIASALEKRYVDDCAIAVYRGNGPKTILYDNRTIFDGSQDGDPGGIYPTSTAGPNGTVNDAPCELEGVWAPPRIINYTNHHTVTDIKKRRIHTSAYDL